MKPAKASIFFLILLSSCVSKEKQLSKSNMSDSASATQPKAPGKAAVRKQLAGTTDTTITYSIEGLSAEGSELKAHYVRDTIKDVIWNIYGETGQSVIKYTFIKGGLVKAEEKEWVYEKSITEVNDADDMKPRNVFKYTIDTTGRLITRMEDKDFVNVFNEMKPHVPFILLK